MTIDDSWDMEQRVRNLRFHARMMALCMERITQLYECTCSDTASSDEGEYVCPVCECIGQKEQFESYESAYNEEKHEQRRTRILRERKEKEERERAYSHAMQSAQAQVEAKQRVNMIVNGSDKTDGNKVEREIEHDADDRKNCSACNGPTTVNDGHSFGLQVDLEGRIVQTVRLCGEDEETATPCGHEISFMIAKAVIERQMKKVGLFDS
jgi:uncharacterized Zn finger protein (UPF0148 family)